MLKFLKTYSRHAVGAVVGGLGFVGGTTAVSGLNGSTEEQVAAAGAALALALYAMVEKAMKAWIGE